MKNTVVRLTIAGILALGAVSPSFASGPLNPEVPLNAIHSPSNPVAPKSVWDIIMSYVIPIPLPNQPIRRN